jgi:hypothetical protein
MSRPDRIQSTIDLALIEIPGEVWDEIQALAPPDTADPEIYRFKSNA